MGSLLPQPFWGPDSTYSSSRKHSSYSRWSSRWLSAPTLTDPLTQCALHPHHTSVRRYCYESYITGEETEAQRALS